MRGLQLHCPDVLSHVWSWDPPTSQSHAATIITIILITHVTKFAFEFDVRTSVFKRFEIRGMFEAPCRMQICVIWSSSLSLSDSLIVSIYCTQTTDCWIYTVFQNKTPTHIIGYKLRSSCLIIIIFGTNIPHIIWYHMMASLSTSPN